MQYPVLITSVKTFADRLKARRRELNMTQAELAAKLGLSQGTIGNLESGIRNLPRDIVSMAAVLRCSADWLMTGRGDQAPELGNNFQDVDQRGKVPLISWVTAGLLGDVADNFHPGEADEWIDIYDMRPGPSSFALRVTGDSMTNPVPGDISFPDGSIIVVNPDQAVGAGSYVVAKDVSTQKATFKKLVSDGGRWYLKPLNPAYPTIEIEDPALRVIGKVTEYQIRGKL